MWKSMFKCSLPQKFGVYGVQILIGGPVLAEDCPLAQLIEGLLWRESSIVLILGYSKLRTVT